MNNIKCVINKCKNNEIKIFKYKLFDKFSRIRIKIFTFIKKGFL